MSVLLGVNAFPATGEGGRRQAEALATWRGLTGARPANLQWADEVYEVDGFETLPVLGADSRTVSGRAGRRLPVLDEAFDRLADAAQAAGHAWFAYANSDISLTQGAVDRILAAEGAGMAFSRMDYDAATGQELEMVTAGIDLFAVRVEWWRANRRRFRGYIGGEPVWDNVYAAILLRHAGAVLVNREPLLRHERHPAGDWRASPFSRYVAYLAALDRPHFSRWAVYHHHLLLLRERGAAAEEEDRLQREVFRGPAPLSGRLLQGARALKAWLAYRARPRERAA
jgi:hypothetical protein